MPLQRHSLLALALGLAVAAPAMAGRLTVVAFGDSTTAPRPGISVYAQRLQKRLGDGANEVRVLNEGVPGNTTAMARQRFERDVIAQKPDLVIIQFGLNDSAVDVWKTPPARGPRVALPAYEANLRYFIAGIRRAGGKVILMTPNQMRWTPKLVAQYGHPPYDPNDAKSFTRPVESYAQVVRRLAAELHVPLVNVYAFYDAWEKAHRESASHLLLDGMHPNDRAQTMETDALEPLVRKELALPGRKVSNSDHD